jgi:pSer/pThr/pTyr-binding forkhead associated (FHA) protein
MQLILQYLRGPSAFPVLRFPHGHYLLGRVRESHVRFPDTSVSRRHCALVVTEEGAFVRDLGSRNSTAVNSCRITRDEKLHPGDLLFVGGTTFRVRFDRPGEGLDSEAITVYGGSIRLPGDDLDVEAETRAE